MSKNTPAEGEMLSVRLRKRVGSLIDSPLVGRFMNFPPVAWVARTATSILVRRRISKVPVRELPVERGAKVGLQATLQQIAHDVVHALGYVGAMVAPYEQGDSLPVRAFYVDPALATEEQIHKWEEEASKIVGRPIGITDPDIARVFLYEKEYKDNLSVKAFKAGGPVVTGELYDLCTPIASSAAKPFINGIQQGLGIRQLVAVPFFLETSVDGQPTREVVGNLFAAKRGKISEQDRRILTAFGRQAAAAIESERRHLQTQIGQEIVFEMQFSIQDEGQIPQRIAERVVSDLGYVGAMVSTYEQGDSLPVRAFYVDPSLATEEQIHEWEEGVSKYSERPLSITDPNVARVFVYQDKYAGNLSVRAFKVGGPVTSDSLYDLFMPIASPASRPFVEGIQQALSIQQVIAVPFFLKTSVGGQPNREMLGNLFAATRSRKFSSGEIELLRAFGQQAAVGIRNAKLHLDVQMAANMGAVASRIAHNLNGIIGVVGDSVQDLQDKLESQELDVPFFSETLRSVNDDLTKIATMVKRFREAMKGAVEVSSVDVNAAILLALENTTVPQGVVRETKLDKNLPPIMARREHLIEAFEILISNALDAMGGSGRLTITSQRIKNATEVSVEDTGKGIPDEFRNHLFSLGKTTKEHGLGYGLWWAKTSLGWVGGDIRVKSELGKGSTFIVSLPTRGRPAI